MERTQPMPYHPHPAALPNRNMIPPRVILAHQSAIARVLLLIFAFCAWSFTAPANLALTLLLLLFLADIPRHWAQLRREPAFLLLVGALLCTSLLALRGAWLFPATAFDQLDAVGAWSAPLLFIVIAWWLRRDPQQVWAMLGCAMLGLAIGVLRRTDWSLTAEVLNGLRYDFGQSALGLAFIASVMLTGLFLFRARIVQIHPGGRARPLLGWTLWGLGLLLLLVILVVTQSRGAALGLAVAGMLYAFIQGRSRQGERSPRQKRLSIALAALLVALAVLLLWTAKSRQVYDWQELTTGSRHSELSYAGSISTRLNLLQVGVQVIAERPLLGFGPGTSATEFLVPQRIVPVSDYQLAHAPEWSHLHSVPLELLVRFGLAGLLIAGALLAVLGRAYRSLWSDPGTAPDLRLFLTLGGVMLLLYCLYDFRLLNLDLRFFCILFLGLLYGLHLATEDGKE